MAHEAGIEARGGVWKELALTLRRLEALALRPPDELGADRAPELQRLQYSLHQLGERIVGLRLPEAALAAQAELADALAAARDATAELAAAMWTDGPAGAAPLVYEWRGALFRVRLARMVLAPARPRQPEQVEPAAHDVRAALAAFALTLAGGAAFVSGAVVAAWPIWAAGM